MLLGNRLGKRGEIPLIVVLFSLIEPDYREAKEKAEAKERYMKVGLCIVRLPVALTRIPVASRSG